MSLRQIYIRHHLLLLVDWSQEKIASPLLWSDVDLEARTITIRAEVAKNKREHGLPLTDFLFLLLSHRKENRRADNDYVFPGRRGGRLVEPKQAVARVIEKSGCNFVLHDLRRGFITQAAKLSVPHHIIKKLVNHVATTDVTDGYIVIDTEHLREPMILINNRFLTLFGCSIADWQNNNRGIGQWVLGAGRRRP